MKYYPVYLDIKDKNCLVVGGGAVGARKAATLAECGAKVTIVSPEFSDRFDLIENVPGSIHLKDKSYESEDVVGMFLVFAATDNMDLNRQIQKDAQGNNILCNVVDAPKAGDFILPSIVHRGDLILAISTSGNSPAFAKKLRKELEAQFGPEYEKMLQVMGRIRKELLAAGHAPDEHRKIFYALIEQGILEMIKQNNEPKINMLLNNLLGQGYSYKDLVSTDLNSTYSNSSGSEG